MTCVALAAVWLLGICVRPARSEDPGKVPAEADCPPQQARTAIERGLAFLERDAIKWRKERGCATCHHGTMTVWALSEARAQSHAVGPEAFAEIMEWTRERMVPKIPTIRDPRPGWRLVGIPAIYLAVMSQNLPVLSRDELNRFAVHLARHQEEDGSYTSASVGCRYIHDNFYIC
jgi:hypothetical protein